MRSARVLSVQVPGGRRLSLRAWEGEGAPLVLLHGLLDSSEGWAGLVRRTRRPCVAIDLPGFGHSDLPRRAEIDSYAEDVAVALHRLGLDGCTLVGHSLGGAVAAHTAQRSERLAALALLAPAGFGRIRLAEAFTLPGVVDVATAALPLALVNPLTVTAAYSAFVAHRRLPEPALVARLRSRARHAPRGVRAATIAIAEAGRAPLHTSLFTGPTAAVWGERDALVPRDHVRGVREAFPLARVEIWPAMGHHPQRERPRQLAHLVEALDRGPEAGRGSAERAA